MKKLLFYIAAMAMAVGCNDNIEEVGSSEMVDPAVEMVYVELNVEMDSASDTRVSIDPEGDLLAGTFFGDADATVVANMNSAANTALGTTLDNYFTEGVDDTPPTLTY